VARTKQDCITSITRRLRASVPRVWRRHRASALLCDASFELAVDGAASSSSFSSPTVAAAALLLVPLDLAVALSAICKLRRTMSEPPPAFQLLRLLPRRRSLHTRTCEHVVPLRLHLRSPAPGSERVSNPRSVLAQARACAHPRHRDRAREKRVRRSARRWGRGGPVRAYQSSRSARRRTAAPSASDGAERWPRGRLCRSPRCGGDAQDPTATPIQTAPCSARCSAPDLEGSLCAT
jgi:hypothetical protein